MYEFTTIERIDPLKKPTNARIDNFEEIFEIYKEEDAGVQASRCIQCGNPYCSSLGCPLSNNIPQWLKFVAEKDPQLAFDISNETSPFPEILGRICPHNRLCEGACTLNDGHGAITIGSIEVAITENGFENGYKIEFPPLIPGKQVAIIGSGPAGLSCATFLLRGGIKPVIFEKADKPGGLLTYGIPGFKLEKNAVDSRIEMLKAAGMEIHLNAAIGDQMSFESIYNDHDAVFLGIGATEGKVLNYEGYNSDNIYMAMPFLTNVQKKLNGKKHDQKFNVEGKKVVVVGGGDTAMDCVRTCIRERAASVKCFYRRDEANMPGSTKEVESAKEEGVQFLFLKSPKGFIADQKGIVRGMKFIDTELTKPDNSGRSQIKEIKGTEDNEYADVVILALGFNNEKLNFLNQNGIETDQWGAIVTDENNQTTKQNVYAGGDGVRGADLVVTAALDGREAAYSILEALL